MHGRDGVCDPIGVPALPRRGDDVLQYVRTGSSPTELGRGAAHIDVADDHIRRLRNTP